MVTTLNAGKGEEKLDHSYFAGRMPNSIATLENSLAVTYKSNHSITVPPSNCTLGHSSQMK